MPLNVLQDAKRFNVQGLLLLLNLQCLYKTPKVLDHLRTVQRRGERDNNRREERNIKPSKWSAIQHYTMTHFYYMLLCISPVGTPSLDGAVGERRGVGWGQQYIPEYMTRCSRSDRSQLWLMKPKHFHRCFYTLGSTSSHRPNSTPTLFLFPTSPCVGLKGLHLLSYSCTVNILTLYMQSHMNVHSPFQVIAFLQPLGYRKHSFVIWHTALN